MNEIDWISLSDDREVIQIWKETGEWDKMDEKVVVGRKRID